MAECPKCCHVMWKVLHYHCLTLRSVEMDALFGFWKDLFSLRLK